MGQTLTHGVYLPDEGERNCYSGLAANWQILDGAVGTIASHTTQIAGKAPAVHTHTKSDITDFPAYGNAAGTICEGNDSRLSDARTPVAHTHTKADITDLLNSNFIPSANNSYDLGSSSYQWNNLYAKNYFYNGVAWGLDKANVWTANQSFRETLLIQNSAAVSAGSYDIGINFYDSLGNRYGYIQPYITTSNQKRLIFGSDTGELCYNSDLIPSNNNFNFGSSTLKWKTLNGINPGLLSFPGIGGFTDIKGDITNLSGGDNNFTAPYDGWVCVKSTNATAIHIINTVWAVGQSATQSTAGTLCCLCPVMSGQSFNVIVNATSLAYAYIHPCRGNV